MSLFSIKLKTKAGNDIKKKETLTVFFRLNYKKGLKTVAEYTYRIIHSNGIIDPQNVLQLKISKDVNSIEDLTLKVILNLCHIIGKTTQVHNIDPDFVLFMSPDLEGKKNKSWMYLSSVFKRPNVKDKKGNIKKSAHNEKIFNNWLTEVDREYTKEWTEDECKKLRIKKTELDMLKDFADGNPNTVFMTIDPNRDPIKYAKSLHICAMLQERIDRKTTNTLVEQP